MVIDLCRTFCCPPDRLDEQDASIMRYAAIVRLAAPEPVAQEVPYGQ